MKKLLPLLLVFALVSCQKEEFSPARTSEFSIYSTYSDAAYTIKVALPEGYDTATQQYATLYVLDGEENFTYVAENCEKISNALSTDNVLVVSIGYGNDRAHDYTPTYANEGGGGAEQFMHFLQDELIPAIENNYRADTSRESRIILGHSFGGLLAAYAFTNYNAVFGNYIMLSPSLWYDNEVMLRLEQNGRELNKENHQLVFLGLGELEKSGRMLVPFEAFYQRLSTNYPGITLERHIEPRLDHVGSKNPNIIEGLHFFFQNQ
jgi:uncharacterized protein